MAAPRYNTAEMSNIAAATCILCFYLILYFVRGYPEIRGDQSMNRSNDLSLGSPFCFRRAYEMATAE